MINRLDKFDCDLLRTVLNQERRKLGQPTEVRTDSRSAGHRSDLQTISVDIFRFDRPLAIIDLSV